MIPDNSSVPKQKLLHVIEKRMAKEQEMMMQQQIMMQGGMPQQGQSVTDIDPELVAQELLAQGIPEEEVQAIIQSL